MGLISALILGGIVGWLASILMKTNAQMGIIANIAVGILGSALGHWLVGLIGLSAHGAIARGAVALGGAAVLILILQSLGFMRR